MILLDFRRHRDRFTDFGTHPTDKNGTRYAYGHCAVICHRNTYRQAMLRLQDRGFIRCTDKTDTDGESLYYLQIGDWQNWRAPDKDRKTIEKMKNKIRRRENLDTMARCTLQVHPPAQQIDNTLLKFWASTPLNMPFKSASLPIEVEKKCKERTHTRDKQEKPHHTADEAVASLAAWRAAQPAKLAAHAAATPKQTRKDRT